MKKILLSFLLFIFAFTVFAEPGKDSLSLTQEEVKSLGLSDKAIEKLSADQIVKIYAIQQRHHFQPGSEQKKMFIPFGFLFVAMIVAVVALILNYKRSQNLHKLVYKSIETGVPVPVELLRNSANRKASDLKRGIILICVGLGIIISLLIEGHTWSVGLIPLFVGIGFLIVSQLDKSTKPKDGTFQNG